MNKMVITHIGKLIVTSDAATIVQEVEVQHPAAKMIAMAAQMQEKEAGDGTNFVLTLCGELMQQAENLIQEGLHPSDILVGYEKASKKCLEYLDSLIAYQLEDVKCIEDVTKCIRSVVAAKHYGNEDILAPLIAKASIYAMPENPKDFSVENVRVTKILGGALGDSEVIHGMCVLRGSETTIHKINDAKVAVFNNPLEADSGDTKGTVLLKTAEELQNYTKGEEETMERFVKKLHDTGINVVISGGSISEVCLHYMEKYGIMVLRIHSKFEVKRIANTLGGTILVRLDAPTPEEVGTASEVFTTEISSTQCTIFKRDEEDNRIATIVLRASTTNLLDDAERAIDDGVNTIKNSTKNPGFCAGGGATEIHLASQIQTFAKCQPGLDQYAVERFGQAFEIIPRTLAENAGLNAEEIIAKLYSETAKSPFYGIDVENGKVQDMKEIEIYDSLECKSWGIKLAVDAVLTILKVDQIIMSKPAGGPKPREARAPDLD
jgi:T-complex protein 1 subunit theta